MVDYLLLKIKLENISNSIIDVKLSLRNTSYIKKISFLFFKFC